MAAASDKKHGAAGDVHERPAGQSLAHGGARPGVGCAASNHYSYVPLDLVEKVLNCEHVRAELETAAAP